MKGKVQFFYKKRSGEEGLLSFMGISNELSTMVCGTQTIQLTTKPLHTDTS
jgi:hypothetical protein